MSDSRRVTFSPSPPLRGVLKHTEPHPRDSGVGSSSSDHTGSSGSLDERFTARDYDLQSNNVDALREALADAIKDIDQWKNKYSKKQNEYIEMRKSHRDAEKSYQTARDRIEKLNDRMEKQDVALEVANTQIRDLESEISQWKEDYGDLKYRYDQQLERPLSVPVISGASYELSTRRTRDQREDAELASRMKERINREQTDSASSHTTRGSRSSEATLASRGSSQRTNASAGGDRRYIEEIPRASNSLISPRQPGTYSLTTAERRVGASNSSSSRSGYRETGNYVPHPLPDSR
ncbi:hypothetical protein F4825DRAFT_173374 [Nemania diffusa]|nr:hypothetical protein F4825DRAFT_173374 [Nemania diffusa]